MFGSRKHVSVLSSFILCLAFIFVVMLFRLVKVRYDEIMRARRYKEYAAQVKHIYRTLENLEENGRSLENDIDNLRIIANILSRSFVRTNAQKKVN